MVSPLHDAWLREAGLTMAETGLTQPAPGDVPAFDAVRDVIGRTSYMPATAVHPALLLPCWRPEDKQVMLVFIQEVRDTRGPGMRRQFQVVPVDPDPCDRDVVLLWTATFLGWVAVHETLERYVFDDGRPVYDPHQANDTGQPVIGLPGRITPEVVERRPNRATRRLRERLVHKASA